MKVCAENRHLRQAANRYQTLLNPIARQKSKLIEILEEKYAVFFFQ